MAHDEAVREKQKYNPSFKCNVIEATVQGALLGRNGIFTESELHQLEACKNKLARRLLGQTRRAWNAEPKKRQISTKELHRKLGIVPIAMELRIHRLGWAKKTAEQVQKDDLAHQQVLAEMFGETLLDK